MKESSLCCLNSVPYICLKSMIAESRAVCLSIYTHTRTPRNNTQGPLLLCRVGTPQCDSRHVLPDFSFLFSPFLLPSPRAATSSRQFFLSLRVEVPTCVVNQRLTKTLRYQFLSQPVCTGMSSLVSTYLRVREYIHSVLRMMRDSANRQQRRRA